MEEVKVLNGVVNNLVYDSFAIAVRKYSEVLVNTNTQKYSFYTSDMTYKVFHLFFI